MHSSPTSSQFPRMHAPSLAIRIVSTLRVRESISWPDSYADRRLHAAVSLDGRGSDPRRGAPDAHHEPDERDDGHADHRPGHDPQARFARADDEAGDEQDEVEGG